MGAQTVLYGLRADGSEFPIEASISQHVEDRHKIYTVILRDVTARMDAARMLEASERRLRGILDSAMDAIVTVDENQRVVLFNAAAEQVFGWSRDQAMGAPLDAFIPERFRGEHQQHVRGFGSSGTSSRRMGHLRIVRGLRRNGEEFPLDASISQIIEQGRRFYTVILRDVTERVRSEEELRRSRAEIHELALVASTAREQEKSRIARELHDELGQALTALRIDVGWLRDKVGAGNAEVVAKLAAMQLLIDGTVAASRRISADLRPLMLDDLGLAAATEWLVQNFSNRTGIDCVLDADEEDLDLQDPHATAVFRVIQESLTNIAKHAEATRVAVRARREGGEIHLTIEDNGRGFAAGGPRKPGSYGLVGLRERAILLDGAVSVESEAGRGTRIDMRLPLARVGEPA
jgi:PAS domain S-box-containing protein